MYYEFNVIRFAAITERRRVVVYDIHGNAKAGFLIRYVIVIFRRVVAVGRNEIHIVFASGNIAAFCFNCFELDVFCHVYFRIVYIFRQNFKHCVAVSEFFDRYACAVLKQYYLSFAVGVGHVAIFARTDDCV